MYKFVILSAFVAVCAGTALPHDTPEVAAAKAAHFAAVEQAKARSAPWTAPAPWAAPASWAVRSAAPLPAPVWAPVPSIWSAPAAWNAWNGAPAPVVVANGQVQDTPEVAAEKAKHFALVADAAVRAASSPEAPAGAYDDGQYRHDPTGDHDVSAAPQWIAPAHLASVPVVGPWAAPVVVANGHVQDTPEVAAAKAQHLAQLRAAGGSAW